MKRLTKIFLVWVSAGLFMQVAMAGGHKSKHSQDIVATAAAAGGFDTLLTAAKAAGLVGALKSEGPITLFAPSDEAFAALPEGTVESLLQPENKEQLKSILLYHVVAGAIPAKDVPAAATVESLQGQKVKVTSSDRGVTINQANVVKADIKASNGIIHVIDQVILPPAS